MIHITAKFKCKDTDGEEHIVISAVYWDTGLNRNIRKYFIELPGHSIKNKEGVENGYYPTQYMTPSQLDIELDIETGIDI